MMPEGVGVLTSSLFKPPYVYQRVSKKFIQTLSSRTKGGRLLSQRSRTLVLSAMKQRFTIGPPASSYALGFVRAASLVVFGFSVCEDVRLQVGRLGKLFVAAVKRANIRAVSSVNTHVCAQIKVQREPLPTALKRALERFLSCVYKLMPLQF